jgi:hypothetical protein
MMSVNKKNYRVTEVQYGYSTKYIVQKRFLWFFWKTIKNRAGFDMEYTSRKGAQAYINFMK